MQQLLTATGAVLLTGGLAASNGLYNPGALFLVTLAAAAVLWAAVLGSPWRGLRAGHPCGAAAQAGGSPAPGPAGPREVHPASAPLAGRVTRSVLGLGLLGGLVSQLLLAPGHLQPAHPLAFRLLALAGAALSVTFLVPPRPALARLRFPLLLAVFAAMGAAVIRASPRPDIDVWHYQQLAAQGLWQGKNPYGMGYPNIYGDTRWTSPEFASATRVSAFPYPPLTVLLDVPAWLLLGDVRYLLLAAMLAAAWAIHRLGGAPVAEISALALLFQSRTFLVLENAWTEPVLLAAWALALLAARRFLARAPSGAALAGLAAALLAASKQYSPILLLPLALALPRAGLLAAGAWAAGGLAAVFLPFVLWNPREIWRDVALMQFLQPFRMDSLSWLAAWARLTGRRLSSLPAFGLSALALAGVLPARPSLQQAALAAPAALVVLVLFSKQAFCNYYWLISGLLFSACALFERRETRPC